MISFPIINSEEELNSDLDPQILFNSEKKYFKSQVVSDSNFLFISVDKSVEIFDVKNNFKKIITLICHTSMITAILSDRNLLYTASKDHTIKIWDKRVNFKLVKTLLIPSAIYYVTVDNRFIYAGLSKQIMIWDLLMDFKFTTTLNCLEITSITELYSDNQFLYVGSDQRVFQIWDIDQNFKFIKSLVGCAITEEIERYLAPGEDETEMVLSFTSDNNYLYSGSGDGIIKLWDYHNNFAFIKVFDRESVIRNLKCFSHYLVCSTGVLIKKWDRNEDFKLIASI